MPICPFSEFIFTRFALNEIILRILYTVSKLAVSTGREENSLEMRPSTHSTPPPPLDGCPVRGTKHGTTKEELVSRNIQEVAQEGGIWGRTKEMGSLRFYREKDWLVFCLKCQTVLWQNAKGFSVK